MANGFSPKEVLQVRILPRLHDFCLKFISDTKTMSASGGPIKIIVINAVIFVIDFLMR